MIALTTVTPILVAVHVVTCNKLRQLMAMNRHDRY